MKYGSHINPPSGISLQKFSQLFQPLSLVFGKRKTAAMIGISCLVFLTLSVYPVSLSLWMDQFFLDWSSRIAGPYRSPDPRIAILSIDMETLARVSHRWPWPRHEMANLLNAIASCSPSLIVVDVLFQHLESETGTADDALLAATLKRLGNVALVSTIEESDESTGHRLKKFLSHDLFVKAALMNGFVWGVQDSDKVIRSCIFADDRLNMESCVLQVARNIQPDTAKGLGQESGTVQRLISFATKGVGIPKISARAILDGSETARELLRDKVVFLGVTAQILHDFHLTPAGVIPGVDLMAASMDSILTGRTGMFYNSIFTRLLMALFGSGLGILLFLLETRFSLLLSVFSIMIFTGSGLLLSEISGHHLPYGPTLCAWFFSTFFLFNTRSFLNLLTIQAMRAEAMAAGKLQNLLFPSKPWQGPNGFHCRGLCIPCQEVGGDYYDYIPQADGSLVFIIGDVTGHGFPAAMITGMAKTIVTVLHAWEMLTPTNVILTINKVLCRVMNRKKNMTVFVGHLNPETGMVTVSSGGHLPAFHVDQTGNVDELGQACLPLGFKESITVYTLDTIIKPGESLVLYTDGIIEALDWKNQQFTFDPWRAEIGKLMPTFFRNPDLNSLLEGVRKHIQGRPFDDDVTLLILHRDPELRNADPEPKDAIIR